MVFSMKVGSPQRIYSFGAWPAIDDATRLSAWREAEEENKGSAGGAHGSGAARRRGLAAVLIAML